MSSHRVARAGSAVRFGWPGKRASVHQVRMLDKTCMIETPKKCDAGMMPNRANAVKAWFLDEHA
jgi:predicted ATP-dependent serine protease